MGRKKIEVPDGVDLNQLEDLNGPEKESVAEIEEDIAQFEEKMESLFPPMETHSSRRAAPSWQAAPPRQIFTLIPKIMQEVGFIKKDQQATGAGASYKYRGVDQVYAALQLIMAKHGVFATSTIRSFERGERMTKNGASWTTTLIHYRWTFWAPDGSCVEHDVLGEGADSGDKSANKSMSVGDKYALLQVFKIPTSEPKDPETDSPEFVAQQEKPQSTHIPKAEQKPKYSQEEIAASAQEREQVKKEHEQRQQKPLDELDMIANSTERQAFMDRAKYLALDNEQIKAVVHGAYDSLGLDKAGYPGNLTRRVLKRAYEAIEPQPPEEEKSPALEAFTAEDDYDYAALVNHD